MRNANKNFTLVIAVSGAYNVSNPSVAINSAMLASSTQRHPYLTIYPDVNDAFMKDGGTTTSGQYALNHWNQWGKSESRLNPYRIQALIALPYFNYNPDVEAAWNSANPANATTTSNFTLMAAQAFAQTHWDNFGKTEKRTSPADIKIHFDNESRAESIPIVLDKVTRKFVLDKKFGGLARTLPYMYLLDGDKSSNVITARLTVESISGLTYRQASTTSVTTAAPAISAVKAQPAAPKTLTVTASPSNFVEGTFPVTITITGEPNDKVYIEYIDPKFNENRLYLEHYKDVNDFYEANKATLGTDLVALSNAHFENFGRAEGRSPLTQWVQFNRDLVTVQVPKREFKLLPSSGTVSIDITENGKWLYPHRVTAYSYRFSADRSIGTPIVTIAVGQKPVKTATASAKAAGKLLKVRQFSQDGTADNVFFYIGDVNESTLPTSVKITVIDSNVPSVLAKGTVIFNWPANSSKGSVISTSFSVDENGANMGGACYMGSYNTPGYVFQLRIEVVSAGGTWTSSSTSNPSDLVYAGQVQDFGGGG
jgi:hypothetical protein